MYAPAAGKFLISYISSEFLLYVFVWSFALSKNIRKGNIHSSECCSIFLLYTICFKQLRLLRLLDKQKRMCSSVPRASSPDHCRQLFSLGISSRDAAKLRGLVWLQKKRAHSALQAIIVRTDGRTGDWIEWLFFNKSQFGKRFTNSQISSFSDTFSHLHMCVICLCPASPEQTMSWRKMASECLIEGTSCKNPPSPKSKWLTLPHTLKKIYIFFF